MRVIHLLLTTGDILMAEKPTYKELERHTKQLEREVLEYVRKEKELNKEQKLVEYGHMKRTISLMKINEELNREIKDLKCTDKEELGLVSNKLRDRIKELNCLYDISSLRDGTNFSLDDVLQAIIDFIPTAIQYPEITCARIKFDRYEFRNIRKKKDRLYFWISLRYFFIGFPGGEKKIKIPTPHGLCHDLGNVDAAIPGNNRICL